MGTFSLRVGWIARERLARLLTDDPAIAALRALMAARPPLPAERSRHRDLALVQAFALRPLADAAPRRRTLVGAAAAARGADEAALVAWCAEVSARLRAAEAAEAVPSAEIHALLAGLAATDFPARLALSQPDLADELYDADGALTPAYHQPGRKATRAFLTAIGYALGAVGRLSPRDAWITAAFGVADERADALRLDPGDTRVVAEPDLAWFERRWPELPPRRLGAGESAWAHLAARVAAIADPALRRRRAALLDRLAALAADLAAAPLTLQRARDFIRGAAAELRASVGDEVWSTSPHRFWITRILPGRVALPADRLAAIRGLAARQRDALAAAGLVDGGAPPPRPRRPYPLRVAAERPSDVLLVAAEFFDWIVVPGPPAYHLELAPPAGSAVVASLDEAGARLDFVDPNPRRAAERIAAAMPERPDFCDDPADAPFAAISPPPLSDNRLIRLAGPEVEVSALRPGDPALFYSSLVAPATAHHLAIEIASPRYDCASDLVPHHFTAETATTVTFGRICRSGRIWLLGADDLTRMRARVHRAAHLAAIYHLEVHPRLGAPAWLLVLLDGQRLALYTASLLSWFYILHELRVTRNPAGFMAPATEPIPPLVVDDAGSVMPAQIVVR